MNLGEKIRYIRKAHSLNQKEFAERLGVSQGTLSDLERGTCSPSSETIAALRIAYHCDLNWLFDGSENNAGSEHFTIKASSEEKELIELFRSLLKEDKDEFIEIGRLKAKKRK